MGPAGNIFDIIRGIHLAGIGGYTKAKSQSSPRCGGRRDTAVLLLILVVFFPSFSSRRFFNLVGPLLLKLHMLSSTNSRYPRKQVGALPASTLAYSFLGTQRRVFRRATQALAATTVRLNRQVSCEDIEVKPMARAVVRTLNITRVKGYRKGG